MNLLGRFGYGAAATPHRSTAASPAARPDLEAGPRVPQGDARPQPRPVEVAPLVGTVPLAHRKVQVQETLRLMASTTLGLASYMAYGHFYGQPADEASLPPGHPQRLAGIAGALLGYGLHVAFERAHDALAWYGERQRVQARGMAPAAQLDRLVQLANQQPLNADGIAHHLGLIVLHQDEHALTVSTQDAAQAIVRLADGALGLPSRDSASHRRALQQELDLITRTLRTFHTAGGWPKASCVQALQTLQGRLHDRMRECRTPNGIRRLVDDALRTTIENVNTSQPAPTPPRQARRAAEHG